MRHHLLPIESTIDFFHKIYTNFIILGDSNAEISNLNMESLSTIHYIKWIAKDPSCYENLDNPTCIYLTLTNSTKYFQVGSTSEIRLSDILIMALTVLKSEVTNHIPNEISSQKCKHCDSDKFKTDISDKLYIQVPLTMDQDTLRHFSDSVSKHIPLKRKHLVTGSKLYNLYLKVRSDEEKIMYKK